MKEISADLGIDVSSRGLPHRRELAKVTTAWKRAKAQAEIKEQTEALQKQHGERITLLPEDWTSIIVQFKAKHGNDLTDDELAAQAYFEDFQERNLQLASSGRSPSTKSSVKPRRKTKTVRSQSRPDSMASTLTLG